MTVRRMVLLRLQIDSAGLAVQTLFPDAMGETATLVNAQILPPLPVLAGSLANELDAIAQDFIVVLDDIHRVQKKSVYDFLTELLRHPPRTMHLVLIGRRDPNLPIASFRAKGLVTEIRLNDLRFTPQETASYLKTALGDLVDEATAATITEKAEGWVTGCSLGSNSLGTSSGVQLPECLTMPSRISNVRLRPAKSG